MKKILVLCAMLFALQLPFSLMAQDTDVIDFTAILNETFLVTVTDGDNQTAEFVTADDYNNGVTEGAGITSGTSEVTVEATGDWDLQISAPDFDDGTGQIIPINNLGVYADATGIHQFGTEITCEYTDPTTALGLQNADVMFIDLNPGNSNAGTAADNLFVLHWEMGTANGTAGPNPMNGLTMFEQMSAGDFGPGTYTTQVTLTLTAK